MKKKWQLFGCCLCIVMFLMSNTAFSAELFVYPAKGQSPEQTEKDKYSCYEWAKNQTGFDPMKVPAASTPSPQAQEQQGGAVKGAARGALLGVAVGAIAGDAGAGAAIGAVSGGLLGGAKKRNQQVEQQQAQEQWSQEEAAKYAQQRSNYDRAYAGCLEGKGYTVK